MIKGRYFKFFLPVTLGLFFLILAPKAFADTGVPSSTTATYNTSTNVLSASGTYTNAPIVGKKLPGFALFIDGADPTNPGTGSLDGVDTNTMHVLTKAASGSWSDSHNLASAPSSVCVVIYDLHDDKIGAPNDGNHSDIPADSGGKIKRNKDNSFEHANRGYDRTTDCAVPTIVSGGGTGGVGGAVSAAGAGGAEAPRCPENGPQKVDQVWFSNIKPGEFTVHWANKGDAQGFHIAYGLKPNQWLWGVDVGNVNEYTIKSLPVGVPIWVTIIPQGGNNCAGNIGDPWIVEAAAPQVLGAAGIAKTAALSLAGLVLIAFGLWQAQSALVKRSRR